MSTDPDVTAANVTPAEAAAWAVAVNRGLNISRADLRALLTAAAHGSPAHAWDPGNCSQCHAEEFSSDPAGEARYGGKSWDC